MPRFSELAKQYRQQPKTQPIELVTPKSPTDNDVIDELENVLQSTTFSLDDMTPTVEKSVLEVDDEITDPELSLYDMSGIPDEYWDELVNEFESDDPISEITGVEQYSYKGKKDKEAEPFNKFSKEYSMLHSTIKEMDELTKPISKAVKELINKKCGSKGVGKSGGLSKSDTDLISAVSSLMKAKADTIDKLVGIRKASEDIKLKRDKLNPPENTESSATSNIADQFYQNVMSGGRGNFVKNILSNDNAPVDSANINSNDNQQTKFNGYSLTEIARQIETDDEDIDNFPLDEADPTGRIQNHNSGVEICIQRFSDGDYDFLAVDDSGREVQGVELPHQALLDSLQFPIGSDRAIDQYGRRYRIIDIDL